MGKLKVGVFGVGRGINIAQNFKLLNCEIVAMCDERKDRMDEAIKKMNDSTIAIYPSGYGCCYFSKLFSRA